MGDNRFALVDSPPGQPVLRAVFGPCDIMRAPQQFGGEISWQNAFREELGQVTPELRGQRA